MRFAFSALWFAVAAMASSTTSKQEKLKSSATSHAPACTATSSTGSGAFFDLRPDMAVHPDKSKPHHKAVPTKDYHARGYDYGKNFTLNICGPVVEPVTGVEGIQESAWANVSAYYTSHGNIYSLGSQTADLRSRGRKLVLQYTGGSPCGRSKSLSARSPDGDSYIYDDSDAGLISHPHEVETVASDEDDSSAQRRKSATISFLCDRDPANTQAGVSFVGADPDECSYFFEARSIHACAHAEPHKPGSVGPGSVFGLILVIAIIVYVLGGVFYNRTVTHARGWRQLPNYSLWASMWSFVSDMFVIVVSSCANRFPRSRGYSTLNTSTSRRDRDAEENRLIDQLDEEWDD